MFNWSLGLSRQVATTGAEAKVIERPAVVVPTGPERPVAELRGITYEEFQKMRDYASVAESIGFRPAELVLTELYDFLEKQGIKVFNNGAVREWLDSKKPTDIDHWCWRPLRQKDIIEKYLWGFVRDSNGMTVSESGYYNSSRWECRPYSRLVPRHALEKVEKIALRFSDEVNFFVSDFAVPDLDPFIMARPLACNDGGGSRNYIVIFDMWDEPGFGN